MSESNTQMERSNFQVGDCWEKELVRVEYREALLQTNLAHVRVKFKKLSDTAQEPKLATDYAAAADLYADEDVCLWGGETKKVNTNIAVEIPTGCCGLIFARSGLATKEGLRPANCVGVIDSDYRGPLIVAMRNDSVDLKTIFKGTRIAQLMIVPYFKPEFQEVEELSETNRGSGGFGSSGKN